MLFGDARQTTSTADDKHLGFSLLSLSLDPGPAHHEVELMGVQLWLEPRNLLKSGAFEVGYGKKRNMAEDRKPVFSALFIISQMSFVNGPPS